MKTFETANYRVVCDKAARSLTIQHAVTWAPVSALEIPDEPGLAEAVAKAAGEFAGVKAEPVKAEAEPRVSGSVEPAEPKPRPKKVNK